MVGGTALNQVWLLISAPLVGGAVAPVLRRILYPSTGVAETGHVGLDPRVRGRWPSLLG
jgi:hypothetical protein